MLEHPVVQLRAFIAEQLSADLPEGVHPVDAWCADPQFFPGATGLLAASSWSEVVPGAQGVLSRLPDPPECGVLVLGNYQATLSSYRRILSGKIGGFPTTWRVLRQLLASISPSEVFLTNSYVGLPDLEKDTAPFPMTESFRRRCAELLRLQCELFRPRAAVCLGVPAAKLLASLATGLDAWQPWPGYGLLAAGDQRLVEGCELGGATFTAVSVQHPSAVISTAERRLDAELIALASALDRC